MARLETVQILAVMVIIVQYLTHLVDCDEKRIIIFMPRRVKTVHHHHHHVVIMDPKTKTMTHAKPYSGRLSSSSISSSSAEVDYQQQRDHHRHYQRQRQQQEHEQQQQSEAEESHPALSYFEQRTAVRPNNPNTVYPVSRLHPLQTYSALPARQKRSKVMTRVVYTH
ncbi:clock-controlled protein 8-like [Melanaphis sacchari]|uniref:clock-controlled protein 8-like n=1 Tax=Melanaphis sacchari TaxID=742174 RepID=UPI000DC15088|nr:clock-controlled protein 8-like [Melanaphis sacchari]